MHYRYSINLLWHLFCDSVKVKLKTMCIMKTEYSQWYIFLLCTFLKFEFDSLDIIKQGEWLGHFSIHLIEENDKKKLFDM